MSEEKRTLEQRAKIIEKTILFLALGYDYEDAIESADALMANDSQKVIAIIERDHLKKRDMWEREYRKILSER